MKFLKLTLFFLFLLLMSCGQNKTEKTSLDPMQDKGIGPVTNLVLPLTIDEEMAKDGKEIFNGKCTACHKATSKFIGPAMVGILERRTPEWIMNMILNPDEMVVKNPIAKQLLIEANGAPMANMHLTEAEARKILEYFRTIKIN